MHPETRVLFCQASLFFYLTFFILMQHHFQVALFCEVRIFTRLPRRPLSPSAPCSIKVPVVLILEKIYIAKAITHLIGMKVPQQQWELSGDELLIWWWLNAQPHIHNTRGGESHGRDNPFPSAGQSGGITAFMTASKTTLKNGFCQFSHTLNFLKFEYIPMGDVWASADSKQLTSGGRCCSIMEEMSGSWHPYMWSLFFSTSGIPCCHSCHQNDCNTVTNQYVLPVSPDISENTNLPPYHTIYSFHLFSSL